MAAKLIWNYSGDAKSLNRMIDDVLKTSKTMHERLHVVACNCAIQLLVHKQSTPTSKLVKGLLGTSIHAKGLIQWLEMSTNVKITQDKDGAIKVTFPKEYKTMALDDAINWAKGVSSFWVSNPPPKPFEGFDYKAELAKLNKKAEDMARAKREGTLKRGKDIIELTPEQVAAINLDGYRPAIHAPEVQIDSVH